MHATAHETKKLLDEYTALAPDYDQRWSAYLRASLSMTTEMAVGLSAKNVLDVGCGTGQLLNMLAENPSEPELFGIDRTPAMLDIAKQLLGRRATLLDGESDKLPFDAFVFELVTCTSALHYFPDPDAALREMRRVITPSGNLIITDWCRDYVSMKLLNRILPRTRHAHVHTFRLAELKSSLASAGFKVVDSKKRKIDWFWGLMTVHAIPDTGGTKKNVAGR
jgi:ubiquinone/menaquinone biosynthesis C-methylase UbiE